MYPGMNAIDFDSSGSNQDHKVRAFPVGTESLLLMTFHADQVSQLVAMWFNRWPIIQMAEQWKQSVVNPLSHL